MELNSKKIKSQLRTAEDVLFLELREVFLSHKPADRVLSNFFREHRNLGSRDRALVSECVYAFFRCWGFLRKLLPEERRQDIESGSVSLRAVEMRALLFGAMYLEKYDLSAAGLLADELGLLWPAPAKGDRATLAERAEALAQTFHTEAKFSLRDLIPEWAFRHVSDQLPLNDMLRDLTRRAPMWLRVQKGNAETLAASLRGAMLQASVHEHLTSAVKVEHAKVNLFTLESFRNGDFEVQDLASQCIGAVASPKRGERWLDCCAGAGGKTLQLASLMNNTGTVAASDIRAYKLEDLKTRARRAGFSNIFTREWDGKEFHGKALQSFDGVLVDAPCSCSGVWRRNPDGRWNLRESDLASVTALQKEILSHAAGAVKPGGVLIYATCSMFTEENSTVVNSFLKTHREFELEKFSHPLNGSEVGGMLQICSCDGDCDSMFAARMRRKMEEEKSTNV